MLSLVLKFRFTLIVLILFYSISSIAYAPTEGNITSYFGPYWYRTNFLNSSMGTNGGPYSPQLGGLGWIINGDISDRGSLEIGLFQMNKVYVREELGKYIAEQTALIHIAMGYRRWFNEYFSGSLTFFSAYSMGSPRVIYSDFASGAEIDTSARDITEYGFDFSLQADLLERPTYALVLDTRYSASVTAKKNENADHFGILLGVRYFYQERDKN